MDFNELRLTIVEMLKTADNVVIPMEHTEAFQIGKLLLAEGVAVNAANDSDQLSRNVTLYLTLAA